MAARVNVKFVIALAALMAVLFLGVAGVFAFVKFRSGDRYLRLGDEAMVQADYDAADRFYARAVAKDPSNAEWLSRWRSAREKKIPETQSSYEQDYSMLVMGILRSLATSQRTNVEAHREFLEALYQERQLGSGREGWQNLINQAEFSLGFFEPEQPEVLRRYRGLAVAALVSMEADISEELREQGRKDLEAVIAADPDDVFAVRELAGWHRAEALRSKHDQAKEIRTHHLAESRRVLNEFLARSPDHPLGLVDDLAMNAADVDMIEAPGGDRGETIRMKLRALDGLKGRLTEVEEQLLAAEPSAIDVHVLARFYSVAARVDPQGGGQRAQRVADHALKTNPEAADLLAIRANALMLAGETEAALDAFKHLAELPNRPVSLDGLRLWDLRRRARFFQANVAINAAIRAQDPKERESSLQRGREFRRELSRHYAELTPEMQYIDGKLLFAEGDYGGAQRALAEFIRSPGGAADQMPEALLMLADCAMRRDAPGLSREYLQQVQAMRPNALEVSLTLARLESGLRNYAQAESIYRYVLSQDPDNAAAKEQLQLLLAMRQQGTVTDPVMQLLVEADLLQRGDARQMGDEQAAIRHLEQGLNRHKYDPRLVLALAQLKMLTDDNEGAASLLAEAAAHHPDNESLKQMHRRIEAADSLELTLALIEESTAGETEKSLARHRAYTVHGKTAEAAQALESAARAGPDDPRVVELLFIDAIRRNDLAEAERIAERAARLDLDRADGDTFRARVQLAQNNPRQAVMTLQRAADRGNVGAPLLRLLGLTQLELKRTTEAISTLRRALELAPADPTTIKTLISALVQSNQNAEALTVARGSEVHLRRDNEFLNMWLSLEADSGNTRFARERREQILSRDPANIENTASLAELYILERGFDAARRLIDGLRRGEGGNSTRIVTLDARWHADRGDLEGARRVFIENIEALNKSGKPVGAEPFLAFGQFMIQRGQIQLGLAAMREAIPFQDPKTRAVEISIGDILLAIGRPEEAEKSYRAAIEGGAADPQNALRKRLIECIIQQLRYADAQRELATFGSEDSDDAELLSLRAEVARGLGDARRARELLDLAVARFPSDPLGYTRRARLLMSDPNYARDAVADLTTVLRLRPGLWQAHRMRATIHFATNNVDEGVRDLVEMVRANPNMDDLRVDAITQLLRHDRHDEALNLALAGASLRPAVTQFQAQLGHAFARDERWTSAARFYRNAWEIAGDETTAVQYIDALVKSAPERAPAAPANGEALRVLSTPALRINESIPLLLSRAALYHRQGRADAARADALQAHSLVGEDPRRLMAWSERLRQIYTDPAEALAIIAATRPSPVIERWHGFVRGMVLTSHQETRSEGISILETLSQQNEDVPLRTNALKALSWAYTEDERWQDAFEATRKGLELAPEDALLNNNAAYFLVEKLDRAAEALPYATRAVSLEPASREILDTLASVQWATDKKDEAIRTLSQALRFARDAQTRASTAIKLARWKLESGDQSGAVGASQFARDAVTDLAGDAGELRAELQDLLDDINRGR